MIAFLLISLGLLLGCGCDLSKNDPKKPTSCNNTPTPCPTPEPTQPPCPTPEPTQPPYPPFPPTPPDEEPTPPPYPPFPPTPPEEAPFPPVPSNVVCPQIRGYWCPCYDPRITIFDIRGCQRV